MLEKVLVSEGELCSGDYPRDVVRNAEAGPAGDFLALIAGMAGVILSFVNFFAGYAGYETVYGVPMIVASAAVALFSGGLLVARFAFSKVPARRSPSWAYFLGGATIVLVTLMALVFGWQGAAAQSALFFVFMDGVVMFIAGMLSS